MRLINLLLLASASVLALKNAPEKLTIGIKKRVPVEECTVKAKKGDNVKVHYVGTLFEDGKQFDSSRDRDSPFDFQLGMGQVIKGWDQGVAGMCVGELRKLVIPYDLAYGEQGSPPRIPAKACLVFEVELISIESKDKPSLNDLLTGEKEEL